jgi:hypothetical protein
MSTQITISPEIKLVVNTTPITGGSAGQILFQTTGNTVGESANLFWDNTNARLRVNGAILAGNGFCSLSNALGGYGTVGSNYYYNGNSPTRWAADHVAQIDFGLGFRFRVAGTGASGSAISFSELGYWSSTTGNLLVGTTTDAGFRLDVNGTASVQSALTVQGMTVGLGGGAVVSNTVVGNVAFNSNTSGQNNTVIGESAMFSNTTGTANVAVGRRALFASNSVQNVALGNDSLRFNTAANNTAVGYFSLYNNTSGASNTSIGHNAGQANTTGANNIFIGANSTGVSATESNRTWIGNSSTATTWLAGNVLINTTTDAGFKLDVNGSVRTGTLKVGGQLDTAATGAGHVFARLNDNGTLIRIFNWSYGNSSGNTWVNGSEVASALFALNSTTTGFLPPRMTNAQMVAITTPAEGLVVYDLTNKKLCCYDGATWQNLF